MIIKDFRKFNEKRNEKGNLLYYSLDWDDNILNMSTLIHMEELVDGEWIPIDVPTSKFADVRNDKNYRLASEGAFDEFRDIGPRGINAFTEDVIEAIENGDFGPAWDDFIECLTNGALFAIITARGHEPEGMRLAIEWILDNYLSEEQIYEMYNNLLKFEYLFNMNDSNERILKGVPSENPLVISYLDNCDFIGISSPSRGGSPSNPEKAKEDALLDFYRKINRMASKVGMDAKIGFSDDDLGNVKQIEDLIDNLNHEEFQNIIEFNVKGTKNPNNITKKRVSINETSVKTPGLESSVLTLTDFDNITNKLYPKGKYNRQDDFFNKLRRESEYLAKINTRDMRKKK